MNSRQQASSIVEIEAANWVDLLPLNRLSKACFGRDAWPWIDMLAALMAPRATPLKAVIEDEEGDEQIVGYVIGDRRGPQLGWIASIGVHPEWQERGIGSRLMAEVESQMTAPVVRLTLRRSNQKALRLYQRRGYRQVEVWPSYYQDGEDGLVMERILVDEENL